MNKVKFFCSETYVEQYNAKRSIEKQINEFAETHEIISISSSLIHEKCLYQYTASVIYKENKNETSI